MEPKQLSYRNSSINYYRFGDGPRPVICFHGYGEDAGSFLFLHKHAGNQYTFYAIDLPFHGKTEWRESLNFSHTDLEKIIALIIADHQQQTADSKLVLMGYSLGGRIALSLYQSTPAAIEKIVLLAPDGLKVNPWYWLATQTWAGNKLFALTMRHPNWFFGLLKGMNKMGMVNTSIFKFVNYYIGDKEVRQLLYTRWTSLRKLKPNLSRIKSFIVKYKTPVRLIYGKHDRIILPIRGELFQKGIEEVCQLTILDTGHHVLHEKHVSSILTALS